jgi:hypothetical protein
MNWKGHFVNIQLIDLVMSGGVEIVVLEGALQGRQKDVGIVKFVTAGLMITTFFVSENHCDFTFKE